MTDRPEGHAVRISPDMFPAAGIDTRLLDCWEVTLAMALLADGPHDVRSALGAQWWFQFVPGAPPRLDVEPTADRVAELTGLRLTTRAVAAGELAAVCRATLAEGRAPMVVTDAYLLPWCPYAGQKHVEHSFVVLDAADGLRVVDAYDNRTQWGDAVPLETFVDASVVAALETEPLTRIHTLVPDRRPAPTRRADLFARTIGALAGWTAPYDGFIETYCHPDVDVAAFDEFCEACWTIERRRGLYAAWLADLAVEPGLADRFRVEIVARWAEVNKFAYLALRRLRAGRKVPSGIADLVAAAAKAEQDLAAELVTEFADAAVRA
jgi:hypothetical protein